MRERVKPSRFFTMNIYSPIKEDVKLYPIEVLDMIENSGFFAMYEKYRKLYNNTSFTNREIYEQVEDLYAFYYLRHKYSSFDSFKTQYARHVKAKQHKQQTLKKVQL